MTYLDVVFSYGATPGENELRAIDTMREVYGIRSVRFDTKRRTVQVEFDASRLKQDAVAKLLRSAGIDDVDPHRGPTFLSSDHAIQAAVRGEGVVLGRSALVADELAAGRLVRPFELSLPAGFAYYVVCPQRALRRPCVKAFRDWLVAEAR